MPPKSPENLKNRGYRLSDETVELMRQIAECLTESTGVRVGMTDAIRIAIKEKAESLGIKIKKKK